MEGAEDDSYLNLLTTSEQTNTNMEPASTNEQFVIGNENIQLYNFDPSSSCIILPSRSGSSRNLNDIDLYNLLKDWNQEHLYPILEKGRIGIEILKIIKWYHIRDLLKSFPIGEQIIFEQNIEKWRNDIGAPAVSSFPLSVQDFLRTEVSSSPSTSIRSQSLSPVPNDIECVSLSTILEKKSRGKQILEYYRQNNTFENQHRNLLIELIAGYFDENDLHLSLATSQRLEDEITQLFPTEKIEFYRIGKRGKLYAKFFNLKRHSKVLKPAKRKLISPKKTQSFTFSPESDAEACMNSLKFDHLSVEEFDSLWQSCRQYRLQDIRNSNDQKTIFEKWPYYKKSNGYRLIDKDFHFMYPESSSILSLWEPTFKNLKEFLIKNIKDKNVVDTLKNTKDEDFDKDEVILRVLKSVHNYLFPMKYHVRKTNSGDKCSSKYTIKDSQIAFVFEGESTQAIEDHISFLKLRGETIQPFILKLCATNDYFVFLDEFKLKTTNILRALDICFKSFFLFNIKYPPACELFWHFIEKFYYIKDCSIKSPKMSSKLCSMLSELKK